jgi:hypothetical protein
MAGIQELRDFAVMAFAHGPSATEDRLFPALAEHALRRTDAVEAVATRSGPRVPHPRRAQPGSGPPSAASTALGCDRFHHAGHGSPLFGHAAIGA